MWPGSVGLSPASAQPLADGAAARSAQKTLAQKTADVAIQGVYDIDGNQGTVRGNGEMNFAANAWSMKFTIDTTNEPGTTPATEQFLMTFTRYGTPVTITPPAQSDTVTP